MDAIEGPVTPEKLIDFGKAWEEDFIKNLPIGKRLKGISNVEMLKRIPPDVIKAYWEKLHGERLGEN